MTVHLPRGEGHLEPGTWKGVVGGMPQAMIRCPECHRRESLGAAHQVDDDGAVTPSVDCPYDDCTWHVHIVLDGWIPRDDP